MAFSADDLLPTTLWTGEKAHTEEMSVRIAIADDFMVHDIWMSDWMAKKVRKFNLDSLS